MTAPTINLVGPSTSPGAPAITPEAINSQVNGALSKLASATFCLSISGNPLSNTNYWYLPIAEPVSIPAGWIGSLDNCRVAGSLANTVLTVSYIRAGIATVIGTVTFLVGSTVPLLSGPTSDVALLPNDILRGATGLVDSALLDVGFAMVAIKQ